MRLCLFFVMFFSSLTALSETVSYEITCADKEVIASVDMDADFDANRSKIKFEGLINTEIWAHFSPKNGKGKTGFFFTFENDQGRLDIEIVDWTKGTGSLDYRPEKIYLPMNCEFHGAF